MSVTLLAFTPQHFNSDFSKPFHLKNAIAF